MAVSPARKAAFAILLKVEKGQAHSDDLLRDKSVSALSPPDRNLTTTLVLVLGIGQKVEPLKRLAHDFAETVRRISRPGEATALARAPAALELGTAISPRDAFLGKGETVPVDEAVGRISAENIAGYPPGIPALLPGELITAEVVAYLRELTSAGARLHGAADPTFTTVRVLVEAPR